MAAPQYWHRPSRVLPSGAPHWSQCGVWLARVFSLGASTGRDPTASLSSQTTSQVWQRAAEPVCTARLVISHEQNGQCAELADGAASAVHRCCANSEATWRSTAMPSTTPPQLAQMYWRHPCSCPIMRAPEQLGHLGWSVPTFLVSAQLRSHITPI